ncbi:hypothetical protein FB45DRAFT_1009686 [Roridomyces roridus]|uniref:Uncharacterized protein n=1 Tax=Roridomyces roridus TaxID=1738132 RepID=A0AAD7FC33_9AGAR|nr:hypothetical protein FB45DRAFT_1009686 [Roridomyces roridus]
MPRSHVSTHDPTHVLKVQGQFEGGHIQTIWKAAVIRNSGMMICNQPSIEVQNASSGRHWLDFVRMLTTYFSKLGFLWASHPATGNVDRVASMFNIRARNAHRTRGEPFDGRPYTDVRDGYGTVTLPSVPVNLSH